jgi:putative cell wall-binding protein
MRFKIIPRRPLAAISAVAIGAGMLSGMGLLSSTAAVAKKAGPGVVGTGFSSGQGGVSVTPGGSNCSGVLPNSGSSNTIKTLTGGTLSSPGSADYAVTFPADPNSNGSFSVTDCALIGAPGQTDLGQFKVLDEATFGFVSNGTAFNLDFSFQIPSALPSGTQICNVAKTSSSPSASQASNRKAGPACFTIGGAAEFHKKSSAAPNGVDVSGGTFAVSNCNNATVANPPSLQPIVVTPVPTGGTPPEGTVTGAGEISFNGAAGSSCTVTETAAPAGYQLNGTPTIVTIPASPGAPTEVDLLDIPNAGVPPAVGVATTASPSNPNPGDTVTDTIVLTGDKVNDPATGATIESSVCGPTAAVAVCDPTALGQTLLTPTGAPVKGTDGAGNITETYTVATTAPAASTTNQFYNFGTVVDYAAGSQYSEGADNVNTQDANESFSVGGVPPVSVATTASPANPGSSQTVTDTIVLTGNTNDDPATGATVASGVCGPTTAPPTCDPTSLLATTLTPLAPVKGTDNAGNITETYTVTTTAGTAASSDQFWGFGTTVTYAAGSKYSGASDNVTTPDPNESFKVSAAFNGGGGLGGGGGGGGVITPPTTGGSGGASFLGVTRIGGTDRIDTADLISQATYAAGGAGAVVLARSDLFPDSLAGTPLAVMHHAPILLTPPQYLDPRTAAEIQRVLSHGGTAYLLGQTDALSTTVLNSVEALGYNAVRIGGIDRFATAAGIGNSLGTLNRIFLADGANFPDALTAAAASGTGGTAIILTNGLTMPAVSTAFLVAHPGVTQYDVGGPAAGAAPAGATLLVGADRYATGVLVAQTFFSKPTGAGVATGVSFPDALTAGPYLVTLNWPMLLTDPSNLPASVSTYLTSIKPSVVAVNVFGGVAAVSANVFNQLVALFS